ncbi:MAG: hypothetical protein ACKV2Q_19085 [Planctomycetaceae bacterium]
MWTRRWLVGLWLGLVIGDLSLIAAEKVELAEPESDTRIKLVRSQVQVSGQLKTAGGGGKTIVQTLKADAQYRFFERRLSGAGRDAETLRAARLYRFASNDTEVGPVDAPAGVVPKKSTLKLPETRHLIVAHGRREGPSLYSPTATLTYDQLDLLRMPGESLSLLGLLPREAVATGDSWKPESWAVQMLCGIEAMTKGEITCQLAESNGDSARVTFVGGGEGATLGATTAVRLTGEFTFDRRAKLIARARVQQTETSSIGAVMPGLEVTANVTLERSLADGASETNLLNDKAVGDIPLEPAPEMQFLRFESWGLRFYHDRNWYQFHQTNDVAVFRLMEQGSLIAQANVSPIPAAATGNHTSEEQFQTDIRQSLGKRVKAITKSETLKPRNATDRRFLFRVTVDGEADGVPMTWFYHLCAAPTGQQASFVFAVETKNLEKFNNRDLGLVRLLEFIPARQASK